jgi:hypothetical protein
MPVQRFAPMTKNFPTFDCDAHVSEPPWLWDRAKDYLTQDELRALRESMWYDQNTRQIIVNGFAVAGFGGHGASAGQLNVLSLAGPGLKHDIQRALNVRNLDRSPLLSRRSRLITSITRVPTCPSPACATWTCRVSTR